MVYLGVDPLFARNIFHNIAGNILLTVTVPFYAVTSVTLVYFWYVIGPTSEPSRPIPPN